MDHGLRTYLRGRLDAMVDAFDKTLLALSGGALTLSVTFMRSIAGDDPTNVCLSSWAGER